MIAVSACLAGFRCRYDGKDCQDPDIVALVQAGRALPLCPELLGGLTIPREPSELQPSGEVLTNSGRDVSSEFTAGAEEALRLCRLYGIDHAILKARSPSCGADTVYDGSFSSKLRPGCGVCARLLLQNGITIESREGGTNG